MLFLYSYICVRFKNKAEFMVIKIEKIIALLVSLIIIGLAFLLFAIDVVTYSLTEGEAEYSSNQINREVEMYRNTYGVPHIIGDSENDMYFMLGYAQAQDRLWQMDYQRRLAKGETAELFGSSEVAYDKFIRAFALEELANNSWRNMSGESRTILTAFSNGINYFIEKHKTRLPFEFDNLEYFPYEWKPTDCIAIYKYMSLQMSAGFRNDLLMGEIADKFGVDKAKSLIPKYPIDAPYIYEASPKPNTVNLHSDSLLSIDTNNKRIAGYSLEYNTMQQLIEKVAGQSNAVGSNAWAVNQIQNNKRIAILANDPHLNLTNPSHWYQVKLTCSNYNITGLMLAGTPMVLIGRNDNIAWGIANAMGDDFDYYIEQISPKDSKYYIASDSGVKKFKYIIDTIKVRHQPEYVYYKRSTARSGVVSDYHLNNNKSTKYAHTFQPVNNPKSGNFYERFCLTYKWTGSKATDDVSPIYYMMKSKNFEAFRMASKRFHSPLLNFVYSDISGNIAMLTAGSIPIRNANCNPSIPNPGWMKSTEWSGYIDKDQMPYWVNPEKKYLFAANNKLNYSKPYFISDYWDNPSRAERLDTLLKDVFRYSARDAQIMQYDVYSPYAQKIINLLIPNLNTYYSKLSLLEKQAFERLKKWDFVLSPDVPSSIIYNQFYIELLRLVFLDDLGEEYYPKYLKLQNYASTKLLEVLSNPNDSFIKNYRNSSINSLNDLLIVAYKNTIASLQRLFATVELSEWRYGNQHYVELKHLFALDKFLSPSFTMERFSIGGNGTTINNTEYKLNESYEAVVGASCRFISNMSEPFVYTSIPGGVSGQIYSSNYSDQLQLWMFGGYVKLPVSRTPEADFVKTVKFVNGR